MANLAAHVATASPNDLWGFAPALEIAGCRHADLEMRLFRS
jgi:urease accessory protein UreF